MTASDQHSIALIRGRLPGCAKHGKAWSVGCVECEYLGVADAATFAVEEEIERLVSHRADLVEQLEDAQKALYGNGHRPPGTPSFHLDGCSGCAALEGYQHG